MLKIRKYHLFIAGIFFLFSCAKQRDNHISVIDDHPLQKVDQINKIEPRNTDIKKYDQATNQFYQNTTSHQLSIGVLLGEDIESLKPKGNDIIAGDFYLQTVINKFTPSLEIRNTKWLVKAVFDNDIFNNTDYYYTNGVKLEVVIPGLNKSPINKILPATRHIDIEMCGFSVTQNIYTPTNPDTRDVLVGDRPFASYLAIGQFREIYNLKNTIYLKSEIRIGVMGPQSFGQQVQSSIHEIEPVGWQNQINNDLVIDYQLQFKKGLYNSSLFDINLNAKGNIGTLQNKVGGGLELRFGHFTPFYSGPLSIFEFENPGGHLQYWLFFKTNGNFVAYDATLQGGLFNRESPYTILASDINHFVFNASMGFAIYYNSIGIEYEHFYLSPEFKGALQFGWGSLKATIAF